MTNAARLLSLNVAVPAVFPLRGRDVRTGIFKEPVSGRIALTRLTLAGDIQADKRVHGGPNQAVYVFPSEHYPHFRRALGRPDLPFGFFGENFTTEGLHEEEVRVGDVYRVGNAVVQVTKPRAPCFKMGLKAGSQGFVRELLESRRLGFYLRVLEEGDVGSGDPIERIATEESAPTIAEDIERRYFGRGSAAAAGV
ncbi:MAG TPA: MOSC domain-containing protein [Thermoanaerobaculia bacterium]